jgi:hypothetical protein
MTQAAAPDPAIRADEDRVEQDCTHCGIKDTDARHHVSYAVRDPRFSDGRMIDLTDTHHMDCGAANGCAVCAQHMSESGNKHGAELIAHLQAQPANANHAGLPED